MHRALQALHDARGLLLGAGLVTVAVTVPLLGALHAAERAARPDEFSSLPAAAAFAWRFVTTLGGGAPPSTTPGTLALGALVLSWAAFGAVVLGALRAALVPSPPRCAPSPPHCPRCGAAAPPPPSTQEQP